MLVHAKNMFALFLLFNTYSLVFASIFVKNDTESKIKIIVQYIGTNNCKNNDEFELASGEQHTVQSSCCALNITGYGLEGALNGQSYKYTIPNGRPCNGFNIVFTCYTKNVLAATAW